VDVASKRSAWWSGGPVSKVLCPRGGVSLTEAGDLLVNRKAGKQ
jgi:hypothetical protein